MTDSHQSFLTQHHAKMHTPEHILEDVVKKTLKTTIASKKRIIAGETNEVWEITTADKRGIFARISHNESSKFYSEKWAIAQCERIGVPTPTIIAIEEVTWEGEKATINLQEKIAGISLEDFSHTAPADEKEQFSQLAGHILAKIHSIPTDGCGDLDENGHGPENNLASWFRAEEKNEWYLLELAEKHDIPQTHIKKAYEYIRTYGKLFDDKNNYLLHGDYLPKHIFVAGGKITGILDWGEVRGGNPIFDFTYWKFYHPNSFNWLLEGYTNKALFDKNFDLKLALCMVLHGIFLLYHNDKIENTEGIKVTKKNFEKTIDLLQEYPL